MDLTAVEVLRRSTRVVAVQPWMIAELGIAGVWFAQLLWCMEVERNTTVVRADHEWEAETGLSRTQVQRARAKVTERGWIACKVRKVQGTPMTHTTLCAEVLDTYLRAMGSTKPCTQLSSEIEQTSSPKSGVDKAPNGARGASTEQTTTEELTPAQVAHAITVEVYEKRNPRPAQRFVAVLAVAKALMGAGYPRDRIVASMLAVPTISIGWCEGWLSRQHAPAAARVTGDRSAPAGRVR